MRNVHARHKLYTNTMRVKEVVKLTDTITALFCVTIYWGCCAGCASCNL